MKLLVWSNAPWLATGYGVQTALFAPRLVERLGHEVAIFAFAGLRGAVMEWRDLQVYPQALDMHGNDAVAAHAKHCQADAILSLMDIGMIDPQALGDVPWLPWFPIDSEPMRPAEAQRLRKATQPLVFTKFAQAQAANAGIEARYVPHGVDRQVFRPLDKRACRESVGLPQDRFIVGMVAMNKGRPSRKAFPEQIQAFARLHQKHPDALLYLHTNHSPHMDGLDLPTVCRAAGLDLGKDVAFVGQHALAAGLVSQEEMAKLYSSLDLLTSASYGEGFGLPILEAQACGVPVVTGEWSAMPEITFAGWRVPKSHAERIWNSNFSVWQWAPHVDVLAEFYEQAYDKGGLTAEEQAATQAWCDRYDADYVTDHYWKPVLAEIEGWLCQGKDAGKLQLVRF